MLKQILAWSLAVLGVPAMYVACNGGSGSNSNVAAGAPFVPGATKQMTLRHGLGYVCWVSDDSTELWCWASEQAAIDNGDAGQAGITSLTPTLVTRSFPGTAITFMPYEHGMCYRDQSNNMICVGNTSSTANTADSTPSCIVTAIDALHCPGEANADLTFTGLTFSRIQHTPTYLRVRRTCSVHFTKGMNS